MHLHTSPEYPRVFFSAGDCRCVMTQCISSAPALDRTNLEPWANQRSLLEYGLDLGAQGNRTFTTSWAVLREQLQLREGAGCGALVIGTSSIVDRRHWRRKALEGWEVRCVRYTFTPRSSGRASGPPA